MACLLGIDIGTSGTKTVLFEETGVPVASHTAEYPLYQPHNGWAEQIPPIGGPRWPRGSARCSPKAAGRPPR